MTSPEVINNSRLVYSLENTFNLPITNGASGFEVGTSLKFVVAENETSENLIEKTFSLSGDSFNVVLTTYELKKLVINDYIYKIIIYSPNGEVVTEKSGYLTVKWGSA